MRFRGRAALALNAVAALEALYNAKLMIVDVALADLGQSRGAAGWIELAIALVASLFLVAVPVSGGALAARGHAGWSLTVALGSLAASGWLLVGLASAFTP
jgi:hypothetical protein